MASSQVVMYEAEVTHLTSVPVSVYCDGQKEVEASIDLEFIVQSQDNAQYCTVKQATSDILNNKLTPVPQKMKDNPDDCVLLISSNGRPKKLASDTHLKDHIEDLAINGAKLIVTDNLTKMDTFEPAIETLCKIKQSQ